MLDYFIIAAFAATALVVLLGILNLGRRKDNNRSTSNILMRWRIAFQALAILLIMISIWLKSSGG
ncbi:twin transmembrane helix small protein [Sneathiella aquimaris]|uniref:twin transmembrane helix small protein n=1 Tax=Sneathiella aquimaris TaxID=2599305 RepID=UPI00146D1058|nr:twin transmembrane helix small protein [Sneathiella aquimaris]